MMCGVWEWSSEPKGQLLAKVIDESGKGWCVLLSQILMWLRVTGARTRLTGDSKSYAVANDTVLQVSQDIYHRMSVWLS